MFRRTPPPSLAEAERALAHWPHAVTLTRGARKHGAKWSCTLDTGDGENIITETADTPGAAAQQALRQAGRQGAQRDQTSA